MTPCRSWTELNPHCDADHSGTLVAASTRCIAPKRPDPPHIPKKAERIL